MENKILTTQNEAALLLQNQNASTNVVTSQSGVSATAIDPLKSAWTKMVADLKVDINAFAATTGKEVKEGAQEILNIASKDFQAFTSVLEKDVKVQVNNLVAALTKEANEDIKPQLQVFTSKLEQNLETAGQKIMADIWSEASTITAGMTQSIISDISSGKKVDIAAMAKELMSSDKMQGLINNMKGELTSSFNAVMSDAKDTWTNSLKQELNGDVKNIFTDFGKSVAATATVDATNFVNVLKNDVITEVNEVKADLIKTGATTVSSIIKDVVKDGEQVVVAAGKKVISKISSLFKKKK